MTATATNGRPARKQLADEIDRLDGVVEALAEGLPEAVAEATREGARQAVRDVIVELLGNPELRALITGRLLGPGEGPGEGRGRGGRRPRPRRRGDGHRDRQAPVGGDAAAAGTPG